MRCSNRGGRLRLAVRGRVRGRAQRRSSEQRRLARHPIPQLPFDNRPGAATGVGACASPSGDASEDERSAGQASSGGLLAIQSRNCRSTTGPSSGPNTATSSVPSSRDRPCQTRSCNVVMSSSSTDCRSRAIEPPEAADSMLSARRSTWSNQTWSWDITKLLGPTKWTYFYLYVVLDIFSRYAVGWMVADRENSALAGRLIEETCHKQGVQPQVLTLHSDRGAPMTSKCTAQLLADLGVTRSLSRPQVSDDNPFSEAQFKTLKYHPGFPGRFHDIGAAIAFCRTFFPWYNTEHRHGGIAMLTPDDVHHNRTQSVLEQRGRTLQAAWTRHPERFVRGIHNRIPFPKPSGSTHL